MSAQLSFDIYHQTIKRIDNFKPVARSNNYLRAHFIFTQDWGNDEKIALFYGTGKARSPYSQILDENNECDVPWEAICEPGTMYVSVYSGDLITASVAPVQIHETGYAEYRSTTQEASKDAFAQVLNKIDGIYDIEEFATWEYEPTADEIFTEGKYYYVNGENDSYVIADVVYGEDIVADTYYNHNKVTFEGMNRNSTYICNTPIDCPIVFNLPEIEDETHSCWLKIMFRYTGSFSSTLNVPEGVKVAKENIQTEAEGINEIELHYINIGGVKLWRFINTHSSIPE